MRKLTCYAWGKPGDWEALCVDLDIATEGSSFAEVKRNLELAVEDFLDYAAELPENNRQFLLSHRTPWSLRLRLRLALRYQWSMLTRTCRRWAFLSRASENRAVDNAMFVIGYAS